MIYLVIAIEKLANLRFLGPLSSLISYCLKLSTEKVILGSSFFPKNMRILRYLQLRSTDSSCQNGRLELATGFHVIQTGVLTHGSCETGDGLENISEPHFHHLENGNTNCILQRCYEEK